MKRFFRIYSAFVVAGIQKVITYKGNFFGMFIGKILYCFVMFFIWKAVFNSSDSETFMDFSLLDMIVYVFLTNVTLFLIDSEVSYNIGEEIHDGNIAMRIIKPIKINISYLAMELGTKIVAFAMIFLPVLIGIEIFKFFYTGNIQFSLSTFILYVISVFISYLLSFYIKSIFGYMAFFVTNLWGFNILQGAIVNFFSGAVIPIAFFPETVQKVFSILPFASLNYTPVMIYLKKYTEFEILKFMGLQILWLIVFFVLVQLIEDKSRKYLSVQGG